VRVSPSIWHAPAPLCGSGKYRTFITYFSHRTNDLSRKMKYDLNAHS